MNSPLIPRSRYISKLIPFLGKPIVKVITGMRRVGKSGVLRLLKEELAKRKVPPENILSINKESLEFSAIIDYRDLDTLVKKQFKSVRGQKYLLIDEVQEIEGWEKAILSILTNDQADIVITGSNATMLSSELASLLTGRYVEIPVYSLSFQEHLEFRKAYGKAGPQEKEFNDYLTFGGLPGLHMFWQDGEAALSYLNSVLETTLFNDVVRRHHIRDISLLERIAAFIFDNCGNLTTAKGISDFFKSQRTQVTVDTVRSYLTAMEHAYLIHRFRRYDLKGKRHLEYAEKFYMGDSGLRYGFIGYRDKDISGILENIVALELLRRGYRVSIGVLNGLEIDFVAERGKELLYLQVCANLSEKKTIEREFGNLERIKDNYPKRVLSLDTHFPSDRNGIRHSNIMEFLLETT